MKYILLVLSKLNAVSFFGSGHRIRPAKPNNSTTLPKYHGFRMSEHDSAEYSEDSETARPNRYNGPASTWQSLTEQERGLAASLTQLRDQDLSIHLYNAHALKVRARAHERSKEERASQV